MSEDVPHYGPMTEQRAREILCGAVYSDNALAMSADSKVDYILWFPANGAGRGSVGLDGQYSADELEAIAWWMRNKVMDERPTFWDRRDKAADPIIETALKKLGDPSST